MAKFEDLTGRKFGLLTVIKRGEDYVHEKGGKRKRYVMWECQCECGNVTNVSAYALKNGHTNSCGCYKAKVLAQKISKMNTTHGHRGDRIYSIWSGIKTRCQNANCASYENYGGRGIKICDEWSENFEDFYRWAVGHGYADNLSIDRVDVDGNYCPENCRWVDIGVQANNKRSTHYITHGGETMSVAQWGKKLHLPAYLILQRLRRGWSEDRALTEPVMLKYSHKK